MTTIARMTDETLIDFVDVYASSQYEADMLVISLPFGRQHRMLLQRGSREHVRR